MNSKEKKSLEVRQGYTPRRRKGRGRLVSAEARRPRGTYTAELDPESSSSTDQRLTEINLKSANSDNNAAIQRAQAAAADKVAHILRGLSHSSLYTLECELGRREAAREPYRSEHQRAYEDARRADQFEFFAGRSQTQLAYRPYNPGGVMMEEYNQTRGEACLVFFGPDLRTSVGIDRSTIDAVQSFAELQEPSIKAVPTSPSDERSTPSSNLYPPSNGCAHECRKLRVPRYGYLQAVCLDCGEVFKARYALAE